MQHSTPVMGQNQKDKQNSKAQGRDYEEIRRNQVLHVIVEKSAPGLRGRLLPASHVLRDSGLGQFDSEFEQLAMDTRCSSERIRQTHLADRVTDLQGNWRTPGCGLVTFPCPINPEPFSVPRDHRLGLHYEQRRAPVGPEAGKLNPKHSVRGVRTKTATLRPLEDCQLVAESKNLNLQRCPGSEPRADAKQRGK